MELIIKGATVISLRDNLNEKNDLFIKDGKIAQIGQLDCASFSSAEVLDAEGLCLCPGFVDLFAQAFLDGDEDREDILSLSRAAALGGYTTVCVHTGAGTPEQIAELTRRSAYACCEILPASRATNGKELLNYDQLKLAGAQVFYDDDGIPNPMTMRNALFRARKHDVLLMDRCRDRRMCSAESYMREGDTSRLCELSGVPVTTESIVVARDILLARESGSPVHLAHISTAQSVDVIRDAKSRGVQVTCSTEPPYFSLLSSELIHFNTMAKLDPPLGNPDDVEAIIQGLLDGTIDCIASGHIPLPRSEKTKSMISAGCGASALETAFAVSMTHLNESGRMELPELLDKLTAAPAEILGIRAGRLRIGDDADLVLFRPDSRWVCNSQYFQSKGKNTPFEGRTLRGAVVHTMKNGMMIVKNGKLL